MAKSETDNVYVLQYGGSIKGVFGNMKVCYNQLQAELSITGSVIPISYSQVCRRMQNDNIVTLVIPRSLEYVLSKWDVRKKHKDNLFSLK